MPRANWDLEEGVIDDWDRDSQFVPYAGLVPPNRVYKWQITALTYTPKDGKKKAQLSIGLTLVPRNREEKEYAGYRVWKNAWPTGRNQFTYVPFLDAIDVNEDDFRRRCRTDDEGNIQAIGRWHNDGKQFVLAMLEDNTWVDASGTTHNDKTAGWVGPVTDEDVNDDADEDDAVEAWEDDEEEETIIDAAPPRRARSGSNGRQASRTTGRRKATSARRSRSDDDEF